MFGQHLQQQMHREIQADVAQGSPDFMHFLQDPGRSGGRGGTREIRSPRPLCCGGLVFFVFCHDAECLASTSSSRCIERFRRILPKAHLISCTFCKTPAGVAAVAVPVKSEVRGPFAAVAGVCAFS